MHLSALSDGFLSDSIHDCAAPIRSDGEAHAVGLVRGLLFLAALACPLALASLPSWLHRHAADASFAEFSGHASASQPGEP